MLYVVCGMCMCMYMYMCLVFLPKNIQQYKSDIKESTTSKNKVLFLGPRGLSHVPFATSGGMKTSENPMISLYLDTNLSSGGGYSTRTRECVSYT